LEGVEVRKTYLVAFLLSLMVLSLVLVSTAQLSEAQSGTQEGGTQVSGIITTDTTWTKANSPYTFTGPVAIKAGITLTIESGVTVNIDQSYLQVNGTLNAIGTSNEPIIFKGNQANRWSADYTPYTKIQFTSSSDAWNQQSNAGCIIHNAILINIPLVIENASPLIDGNQIISNNTNLPDGVVIINSGSPFVSNNFINISGTLFTGEAISVSNHSPFYNRYFNSNPVIFNNTIVGVNCLIGTAISSSANALISSNCISGWTTGIYTFNDTVSGNLIYNNYGSPIWHTTGVGVSLYEYQMCPPNSTVQNNTVVWNEVGINIVSSSSKVTNNNIYNNNYNVQCSLNNINVTYNWWGTIDINAINNSIYDFKNDYNLGNVSFIPFLSIPNTQAPTYTNASAGIGGSISPCGISKLNYGDNQTFTITPNNGYHVVDVIVNGTSVGAFTTYTVQNITDATTISATFAPDPTPTPTPTANPTTQPTQQSTSGSTQQSTTNPTANPTTSPIESPTSSPSPSPTIPEFTAIMLLPLFTAVLSITLILRKRTIKKL